MNNDFSNISFKEEYAGLKNAVEQQLDAYIPLVDERSHVLYDAMKYSLDAGGKRLRPVLVLAACKAVGGSIPEVMPFACAIEFIHTYSLIHDDHPSMDNDDLRRGKPTNHRVFGDDIAILAGDGLLNSGIDIMLEAVLAEKDEKKRGRLLRAAYEISRAAGVRGMVAGQTTDVVMTGGGLKAGKELSCEEKPEMLRYIHKNKTGALIRAAVRAGAVAGGAGGEMLDLLTEYAEKTGLVFQIVDDILDVVGDEAATGKKTGMDAELDKLTYPSVYGLEKSYKFAEDVTNAAVDALRRSGADSTFLENLALELRKRIS